MIGRKTKAERVTALKHPLNEAIVAFDNGTQKEGVQALQKKVLDSIKESKLSKKEHVHGAKAAVHPDNRDGSGLVAADVHDLMRILVDAKSGGWDDDQCAAALACEIHRACAVPRWCAAHACVLLTPY